MAKLKLRFGAARSPGWRVPPADVAKLRVWLEDFAWEMWDRQIEADAKAGKLDQLAEEALAHHRAGRTRPL